MSAGTMVEIQKRIPNTPTVGCIRAVCFLASAYVTVKVVQLCASLLLSW